MTDYETGFDHGERQAFKDRRLHMHRTFSGQPQSDYDRGYRDGYTPRSLTWALHKEPQPFWQERESEIA